MKKTNESIDIYNNTKLMNSNMYYIAILLLGLFLTASSCNKNQIPDENKDWNVLEWTVDGERYKAECEGDPLFGCDPVDCQYYHDTKTLNFHGSSLELWTIKINIYRHLNITGNNYISENDIVGVHDSGLNSNCWDYFVDTSFHYSIVIVDLDTMSKNIEGNFEFTGINNCLDTVKVTDGYFKLTYRP